MEKPLVSIITPILNGEKYLEQCIRNVLSQDYEAIEHIFVDGDSKDRTIEILEKYHKLHPKRVRYFIEKGSNSNDAWNKGWEISNGEIFGELGVDDRLNAGAITTVVNFFKENPDAHFVFGKCNYIDDKDKIIMVRGDRDFDFNDAINFMNPIPCTSAFYRKSVIKEIGPLDGKSVLASDYDYWIRVATKFKLYRIDNVLSSFRIHPGSISGSKNAISLYSKDQYVIARKHGKGSVFSPVWFKYVFFYKLRMITKLVIPLMSYAYLKLSKISYNRIKKAENV
jgi:glycosyltransferase involved in cell wall biosynthesis